MCGPHITSAARTVADCFRFERLVGPEAAMEALHDGLRRRKVTVAEALPGRGGPAGAAPERRAGLKVDMSKDVAASVRMRLLNLAKARGEGFEFTLTRFAAERLLFRLGTSGARDRCILKGASLLSVWLSDPYRATRDVDVLASGRKATKQSARWSRRSAPCRASRMACASTSPIQPSR